DLGYGLDMPPGRARCLTADAVDCETIDAAAARTLEVPGRIGRQRLRAKALDVFQYVYGIGHVGDFDVDYQAEQLRADPEAFCRRLNRQGQQSRVIRWQWPQDLQRDVMVPPGHFLMVVVPLYFEARLVADDRVIAIERAIEVDSGSYVALFVPLESAPAHRSVALKLSVYAKAGCQHRQAPLLYLANPDGPAVSRTLFRDTLTDRPFTVLATNGTGAVMRANTWWGRINSRYDALLAANMNREMPVDRWIMLSCCRAWVVYQDYSQALRTDCIVELSWDAKSRAFWQYRIPTGLGRHILFSVAAEMVAGQNRIRLHFYRHESQSAEELADERPIRLIVRPDVENRSFHETTKAYTGPEHDFPAAVRAGENGFAFVPDADHRLDIDMASAAFVWEPEWRYMVHRPLEAERGLDSNSDLFSPGYFQAHLRGGRSVVLDARVGMAEAPLEKTPVPKDLSFEWPKMAAHTDIATSMEDAMDHFVVDRQHLRSVIAGYPWFLDWGRDSLIFCRGLIAAGKRAEAAAVIKLFGQFEEEGTLPNMICGDNAGNRDTSDAPLWFMVACRDMVEADSSMAFLDEACGHRTIREILFSIAAGYAAGTSNGVKMDAETGLVYSPAHFTWMDTNFPAGTPRQGYPIEIQALWYAGLSFLSRVRPPEKGAAPWPDVDAIGQRVAEAIGSYFYDPSRGFLSDCRHGAPGCPPGDAAADDALRPNQLFAITMGAVSDFDICRQVLSATSELVVPGAIRSLADRAVSYPIEIRHNGELLGDPYRPYRGRYTGDEDHCRKPAYHNGTAWTWVFPSFCEAWAMSYGEAGMQTARAWLASSTRRINENCLGHMPEIVDGDFPHYQRGCDAQAWSASELYRVWQWMSTSTPAGK
ncbi:MAG: amylo-alpha-1,6-glucosidase, partial [Thermodesulfobacteriota bacterium]